MDKAYVVFISILDNLTTEISKVYSATSKIIGIDYQCWTAENGMSFSKFGEQWRNDNKLVFYSSRNKKEVEMWLEGFLAATKLMKRKLELMDGDVKES